MVTNSWKWIAAILTLAMSVTLAADEKREAQGPAVKVGGLAPALQVSRWVQGEPVKGFDRDKAYVVEFWATWCGPCKTSIPHLNEIWAKFKDKGLVVIGQDVWESDVPGVEPFVKQMGEQMTYRVALDQVPEGKDSEEGKMAKTWMAAAGQRGIPMAFLVDKQGRIAWIGHPMEIKEALVEQVLAGTFDMQKAVADAELLRKNRQRLKELQRKLDANADAAFTAEDWAQAESLLNELEKQMSPATRLALTDTRLQLFMGKGDFKGAFKYAGELSDSNKDNGMFQNNLAWSLAVDEKINDSDRDLDLLEKIAGRANEAAGGKNPTRLDTLARILFMNGEKDKAIETQEKAVTLATGNQKDDLQKTLDSYKEGKLPKITGGRPPVVLTW
jgi:thiol-disulfide isomerase/thioredoxin